MVHGPFLGGVCDRKPPVPLGEGQWPRWGLRAWVAPEFSAVAPSGPRSLGPAAGPGWGGLSLGWPGFRAHMSG